MKAFDFRNWINLICEKVMLACCWNSYHSMGNAGSVSVISKITYKLFHPPCFHLENEKMDIHRLHSVQLKTKLNTNLIFSPTKYAPPCSRQKMRLRCGVHVLSLVQQSRLIFGIQAFLRIKKFAANINYGPQSKLFSPPILGLTGIKNFSKLKTLT